MGWPDGAAPPSDSSSYRSGRSPKGEPGACRKWQRGPGAWHGELHGALVCARSLAHPGTASYSERTTASGPSRPRPPPRVGFFGVGWPRPARTAPMAPPRAPRHDSPGKANGDHTDGRNHAPCWRNVATCTYAVAFQRMGRVPYQPRRLAHATLLGSRFACQSMNINFQLYPSRDKLTYKFIVN